MNKLCYRIIYNRTRQLMVVVSELTKSSGENSKRNSIFSSPIRTSLNSVAFILLVMQGLVSFSAQASQIIADQHAPQNQQATVLQTSNGLAQVNIQQPNQHGVSRNQFTQFDVDNKGAILNNSLQDTQTQLAGMVTGNPWLVKGEAKVILNEINSQNPSQLNGFIEVAGQRAEIIIANPAGISCQGCGFINAVNTTLVAGNALTQDGAITGYEINNGKIVISGNGLNDTASDYTRILARAVEINSRLQANKLEITTGKNRLDNEGNIINQDDKAEKQTDYAIDVALVGGMYANKIKLIGTEHGVGVHNAGEIGADIGGLTLNNNGQLVNSGKIQSHSALDIKTVSLNNQGSLVGQQDLTVTVESHLANSGTLQAKNNIQIDAKGTVSQTTTGKFLAQENIQLEAENYLAEKKSQLGAGVNHQGDILKPATMTLNINNELNSAGQHLSGRDITFNAKSIDLSKSHTQSKSLQVKATEGHVISDSAQVNAEKIVLDAGTYISNRHGEIKGDTISLTAPQLIDNAKGKITQTGSRELSFNTNVLNNQQGEINTEGVLNFKHKTLNNKEGNIQSLGNQLIINTTELNNQKGIISLPKQGQIVIETNHLSGKDGTLLSAGHLSLQSQQLDLEEATTQAENITITAINLNHDDATLKQTGDKATVITVEETLSNQRGKIQTQNQLTLEANIINNNQGEIRTLNNDLVITTQQNLINTEGKLIAATDNKIEVGQLDNSKGLIQAEKNISLTSKNELNNQTGKIITLDNSQIQADRLNNQQGEMGANTLSITLSNEANNKKGIIVAQDTLHFTAKGIDNSEGSIQSESNMWIDTRGNVLNNQNTQHSGGINSRTALNLLTGNINNTQGFINARKTIDLRAKTVNNLKGQIVTEENFTAKTQGWDNTSGLINALNVAINTHKQKLINRDTQDNQGIQASQKLELNTGALDNYKGDISGTTVLLTTDGLDNGQGIIDGKTLDLNTGKFTLINQAGKISLTEGADLKTGEINNQQGLIITGKDLTINSHQQIIDNRETKKSGGIVSQGKLTLESGELDNLQGQILAKQAINLTTQVVKNNAGKIASELSSLTLKGLLLDNTRGHLFSPQNLLLTLSDKLTNGYTKESNQGIEAQGSLTITSGNIDSTNGRIVSGEKFILESNEIINQQGILGSLNNHLSITSKAINNNDGSITAHDITINTQGARLSNQSQQGSSQIFSKHNLTIESGAIDNTKGKLIGQNTISITNNENLNNLQGQISSAHSLEITTKNLNNAQGQISANKAITVTSGNHIDNTKGKIEGHDSVTIENNGQFNNTLGQVIGKNSVSLLSKGDLINYKGRLGSEKSSVILNTYQIDNRYGVISAQDTLALDTNKYGINNADTSQSGGIVSQKNITLKSGKFNNEKGHLIAKTDLIIDTQQQKIINHDGVVSADNGLLTINSNAINNVSGLIYSFKNMLINTQGHDIDNSDTKNNKGILTKGNLLLNSGNILNLQGNLSAEGLAKITFNELNNEQGKLASLQKELTVTGNQLNNNKGLVYSSEKLKITLEKTLNNNETVGELGIVSHGDIEITAKNFDNQQGRLIAKKDNQLSFNEIDNQQGTIASQAGKLIVNSQSLFNSSGLISAFSLLDINTHKQKINNHQGVIVSQSDNITIKSGEIVNDAGLITGISNLDINTHEQYLDNSHTKESGGIVSKGELTIHVGDLINEDGKIISTTKQSLFAQNINNKKGKIGSLQDDVSIDSLAVNNQSGLISAKNDLTIETQGNEFDNSHTLSNAGVISQGSLNLFTGKLNNQSGYLFSAKSLLLNSLGLNNQNGEIASQSNGLKLVTQALNNQKGTLYSAASFTLDTQGNQLDNSQTLTKGIISKGTLILKTGDIINTQGRLVSDDNVNITSGKLINNQAQLGSKQGELNLITTEIENIKGVITAEHDLVIKTQQQKINNQNGTISTLAKLVINSGSLFNQFGKIASNQHADITAKQLDNTKGTIASNNDTLKLQAKDVNNHQGLIYAEKALTIHADGALTNTDNKATAGIIAKDNLNLKIKQLDNQAGLISVAANLDLTSPEKINNLLGLITVGQKVELTTSQLNNFQGKISSIGLLKINHADSLLNNREGSLVSSDNIWLKSGILDNQQGYITAGDAVTINSADLQNHKGTLYAKSILKIDAQKLDNTEGLLQSDNQLSVNTNKKTLINTKGSVISGTETQLDIGTLNNQKGHIQSIEKLDIQLNQQALDNQQGTLLSKKDLVIKGDSVNNKKGHIVTGNNANITLAQSFNNQLGQVQSQGLLVLNTQKLDNQQTQNDELGLKASNIRISTDELLNHQGIIQASELLTLTPTEKLNNQSGLISANELTIAGSSKNNLAIDNKKGLLAATTQLRLWAENLTGDGDVISAGKSEIQLKSAFVLDKNATIKAQDSLILSSEQEIDNRGFIYAGNQLSLQAMNFTNHEPIKNNEVIPTRIARSPDNNDKYNGEISAKHLTITVSDNLYNTGLIDAFGGKLSLTATTIYNQVGGRIYGDNIYIKSQRLDNNAEFDEIAPVLASRENLQLFSNTINNRNHALIYSGDDMVIAGFDTENPQKSIAADVLNNESASIEASGNLFAHISEINNRDLYLKISDPEKVSEVPMYQFGVDYSSDKFDADDEKIGYNINTREHLLHVNGRQYKDFYEFKYNIITEESKLLHRDPALILAGKDITLKGDNLNNIDSHIIAGGKLIIDGMHINNQETAGQHIEYHEGTAIQHKRPGKRKAGRKKKSSSTSSTQYGPFEVVTDLPLGLLEYKENSNQTSDKRPEASETNEVIISTKPKFGLLSIKEKSVDVHTENIASITLDKGTEKLVNELSLTQHQDDLLSEQNDFILSGQTETKKLDGTIEQKTAENKVLKVGDDVSITEIKQTEINQPNLTLPEIKQVDKQPLVQQPIGKIITVPQLDKPIENKNIEVNIQTIAPILKLPENRLFNLNKGTDSQYIVETDSRFTNKRAWLSSDYMQNALSIDHNNTHKRIGDGFYEQRIVRDQIIQLTGNQYLDGHNDNEQQYHALMDAGIRFSEEFGIKPGVTLTAEQMAMITADMVLLSSREITLPNGSVEKVLVPQVYARVLPGDLQNSGALLSGSEVILNNIPELKNQGTILSKNGLQASTDNLINQGLIKGKTVDLTALHDIKNEGGQIAGQSRVNLQAGHSLISTATTKGDEVNQWINRGAAIYLTEPDGEIALKATRNLELTATDILAGGHSQVLLNAGENIELGTINTVRQENIDWDSKNYLHKTTQEEVGSRLYGGDIALQSGEDIHLTATDIQATGLLGLHAGNDISLKSGYSSIDQIAHSVTKDKSFGSSETRTTHAEIHHKQATGSLLKGNEISVSAGNNLTAQGSEIIATQDINLDAGHQLSLTTAQELEFQSYEEKIKKSGIGGTGGIGFTVGKSTFEQLNNSDAITYKGSVIGSTEGNIRINSGDNLTIDGSEMIAKKEISLTGDSVDISSSENSYTELSRTKSKQSGVTVALSGTAGSAINGAIAGYKAAKETDDSQISTLQSIKAGLSGAQAVGAVALDNAQSGTDNESTTLIGANVAYGKSSSGSETIHQRNIAQGSSLSAGENLAITATGKETGNITVTGSELQAGNDLSLIATRDITLQSAKNQETTDSKNESKSASVGVGVTVGSGGVGVNINANGSRGKGFEEGDHTYYTNTTLNAGQTLTLQSGQDTTLKGAQAQGDKVIAKVGGDLHLESQQSIDDYKSKQSSESVGGSVNVMGTPGGSANISFSRDKMDSKYRSVEEQTGLFAGNQGFDLTVGKHTQLDGAVISSKADAKNNQLDTGTLGFSDIHNYAEYKVEHQSGGVSTSGGVEGNMLANMGHALAMAGNHSDSAENTTQSAVSQGTWTVRDSDNQQQDIAQLSQDTDNAHSTLNKIFDKEKEQNRQQKQQLVGEIGAQVIDLATTVDTIRGTNQAKADSKLDNLSDTAYDNFYQALSETHDNVTERDIQNHLFQQALQDYTNQSDFGTGGKYTRAIQAITAFTQGVMGNNIVTAIANGSAPYLANEVKNQIQGNSVESDIQRTIAHGLLNAGLALAKGENALVQASGAMTGETVGILSHSFYGKTPEELTETEKQNISAWATLTSGIVGGLISDNSTGVANAAQAGKVVVENNAIGAAKPIIKGLEKGYEWCMKNATCRNGLMQLGVNFGLTSAQIQEAMDAGAAARNGDIKAMRNLSPEQVAYIDEQIIHNKGLARLIFGSEPWGGRLGIPSHTGGNQMPDQDRIDTGGNQIPDQGQTDTGGDQISVQIWTDTGGDQIPKPRDNLTETPLPEKPTLDDVVYLDKITQSEHEIEDALKKNLEASQKGNESSKFGNYLTKEEQIFATKAHQELINEIGKFKSNTQAEKIATMIGAYDSKTGKTAVGYSNKEITADSLHPTTVDYIKKQLGVEIGEFTHFCKNKVGACAEVSAADSLVRQGAKPGNIKFTDALRPKAFRQASSQENGNLNSEKIIIETCDNCKVTWPKEIK
ncbi:MULTISPECIES: hemagglutinin repeat-containing protein [Gammaproteobacteria]|uniref:hemagglutinin repeat-containing protein n=1 Tax=Gammaproteobacteria TaxID=1236 RepID=UPI00186726C2|nr:MULTISPECIES: hemagglutinin repeat-containing protein [Gammaproteobacteria]